MGLARIENEVAADDFVEDSFLPFEEVRYLDNDDEDGDTIRTGRLFLFQISSRSLNFFKLKHGWSTSLILKV